MPNLTIILTLTLIQDSEYIEYYYRALRPFVHYVPFYVTSAEDVLAVLSNATHDDEWAQSIAQQGQQLAHTILHVDARMCYWRVLLHGWSRRLAFTPNPEAWPAARPVRTADYVCGECRRPPNPKLIGPWPIGHPCASRKTAVPATMLQEVDETLSVRRCRDDARSNSISKRTGREHGRESA